MLSITSNEAAERQATEISIITPSFNMIDYLRLCCASVADQQGVKFEHIVMDGCSTDGTIAWLRCHPELKGEARPDNGMYDAVNKGFRAAKGGVVSHLNCDEQYLPGTLAFVARYFRQHPDVDVLFGNVLTVRPDGRLIAYRKGYRPIRPVILSSVLHVYTAAMFLRRRVIEENQLYDDSYKDIGDAEFILRLLRAGYRIEHVPRYMATFTITGHNRSAHMTTIPAEIRRLRQNGPWWVRHFTPVWRTVGYGAKLLNGAYFQKKPIVYEIYSDTKTERTNFVAHKASFRWQF